MFTLPFAQFVNRQIILMHDPIKALHCGGMEGQGRYKFNGHSDDQ